MYADVIVVNGGLRKRGGREGQEAEKVWGLVVCTLRIRGQPMWEEEYRAGEPVRVRREG